MKAAAHTPDKEETSKRDSVSSPPLRDEERVSKRHKLGLFGLAFDVERSQKSPAMVACAPPTVRFALI